MARQWSWSSLATRRGRRGRLRRRRRAAGSRTPGSYFVVQDTRLGGPARAIDAFLRGGDTCYVRDRRPEYYYITQHWGGYLYKKRRCGAAGAAETLE